MDHLTKNLQTCKNYFLLNMTEQSLQNKICFLLNHTKSKITDFKNNVVQVLKCLVKFGNF